MARPISELFLDLKKIAQADGAIHLISKLVYRDWIVKIDIKEKKVSDTPEHRWSTSKLNKNEILLLLGLMVQAPTAATITRLPSDVGLIDKIDQLLEEFHQNLMSGFPSLFTDPNANPMQRLKYIAQEAIYYGAESMYFHQYIKFSRERYRNDSDWLLANVGISIRPIIEIAQYIVDTTNMQITYLAHQDIPDGAEAFGKLTSSFCVSKTHLREKFGSKADAFLKKFAIEGFGQNSEFDQPFAVNRVSICPIIDIGEYLYVPHAYRLMESVYESPFYWMYEDRAYQNAASINRGAFLEKVTAKMLAGVFGEVNTYRNVTIQKSRAETSSEADVLVVYGEFVVVVQAKSKRITLKARAGDIAALEADFSAAIQAPYRQALRFSELLLSGEKVLTSAGVELTFAPTTRVFPLVILSDGFPSVTFLSSALLERAERIAPAIWDIGVLDCVTRVLQTPIDLLAFLKARSDTFERIMSDSEFNILGYHVQQKLAVGAETTAIMIDRDFAAVIDDFMMSHDMGLKPEPPQLVMHKAQFPILSDLLSKLHSAPPEMASLTIDLYEMSGDSLINLGKEIQKMRNEVQNGKALKALSLVAQSGGITYVVCAKHDDRTRAAAQAIGEKHKYDRKADRWFVLLDCIETISPIDGILRLVEPWKFDSQRESNSELVGKMFGSRVVNVRADSR